MKTVALGDVVEEFRYGTSNKSEPDGEPTLRIPNVVGGAIDTAELKTVPVEASEFERLRLAAGDLLFVRSNGNPANVGRCAVFEPTQVAERGYPSDRFIYASYLIRARLRKDQFEPAFVARYLSTGDGRRALMKNAKTSAGQFNINISGLSAVTIPLLPIDEQRRIAGVLDQADAIRIKRRQVLAHLDTLTQSILHDMFGGSDKLVTVELADVADVASGITKGRRTSGPTRLVPYLAVMNVQAGYLKMDLVKEIEATDAEISRYALQDGDLILTEGGDPDKLGRGTVWHSELPTCLHQNHIFRVRVNTARVISAYLEHYTASRSARSYFLRSAKQTTGIASINKTQLKALPVELPPLQMQREFASRAEQVDAQRAVARRALDADNELFASLQARAFRGEL